ncbi:MAG TPA: tetratricopeptide repeat protein [Bacteroidales bacterium]|nr:tetratricopeptide repeat protein [Bacteroidales bacterium]
MFGGGPFWLDSEVTESIELVQDTKKISAIFKSLKFSEKHNMFLGKLWLIRALLAKYLGNHTDRYKALKNTLKYLSPDKYDFLYTELCSIYSDLISQKSEKNQDINPTLKKFKQDLENFGTSFRTNAVDILHSVICTLFESKLYNDVVEIYRLFKEKQITEAGIWFEVGYSLNEIKEHKEAKIAYERQIKYNKKSSATLNNLANIYKSDGDLQKAIELYQSALELDPDDEIPRNNLARTLKEFEALESEKLQLFYLVL